MSSGNLYTSIVSPHISEKSMGMRGSSMQYTFKVCPRADKKTVKQAIEEIFKVSVTSIRMINVKGKTKRFGRSLGKRKDIKKAIVSLASGQHIDFMN